MNKKLNPLRDLRLYKKTHITNSYKSIDRLEEIIRLNWSEAGIISIFKCIFVFTHELLNQILH